MKEECGVFAINYYKNDVNIIEHTIKGLEKLQHRGQDSAGISYLDNNKIQTFKNTGLVKDVFQDHNLCCKTNMTIGHVDILLLIVLLVLHVFNLLLIIIQY